MTLIPSVATAFVHSNLNKPLAFRSTGASTELAAEGGPPQYEKKNAKLIEAETVGEGSVMLHIGLDDDDNDGDILEYKPGHVLALEIEKPASSDLKNEKNMKDADQNGGWMRGPYTVSRATEKSLDILIKVVGDKSKNLASAQPGTPLKVGGKFHVPIYDGINKDTDETKRVVLISTGVGIGPCMGAIEEMLADNEFSAKIDLFASFRTEPEIICKEYLDGLAEKNKHQFTWTPIVTEGKGRISDSAANMEIVKCENSTCSLKETHYHLIGNGQLVNEWKQGLAKAGVPEEKVTVESYFNHKANLDNDRISRIANEISKFAASPVV